MKTGKIKAQFIEFGGLPMHIIFKKVSPGVDTLLSTLMGDDFRDNGDGTYSVVVRSVTQVEYMDIILRHEKIIIIVPDIAYAEYKASSLKMEFIKNLRNRLYSSIKVLPSHNTFIEDIDMCTLGIAPENSGCWNSYNIFVHVKSLLEKKEEFSVRDVTEYINRVLKASRSLAPYDTNCMLTVSEENHNHIYNDCVINNTLAAQDKLIRIVTKWWRYVTAEEKCISPSVVILCLPILEAILVRENYGSLILEDYEKQLNTLYGMVVDVEEGRVTYYNLVGWIVSMLIKIN